jgi:hypothetical protein
MAIPNTLEASNVVLPQDLVITAQPNIDTNYFTVTAKGLELDSAYNFQFQWVYTDGTVGPWSPSVFLFTPTEGVPGAPSVTVPADSIGYIPVTLSTFPDNALRVDVKVTGGDFGLGKLAHSFFAAGTTTIAAKAGVYYVELYTVTPTGVNGTPTSAFTITVDDVGEVVQSPTNPNGFSIDRVLGGIQVNWAGTYANGTFTGFEAIKIYVGNSATATAGSYKDAGVMTGNNVVNSITIPVDGTYLRYDLPVYIHAAAINKANPPVVGTMQVNVANNNLGARSAISSDLADNIITNSKIVNDAVSAGKIATSAITETKIATDAVTSSKIIANAITADKIVSSAITADKIAANAITAGKILAGEIDVTKLAAGTISVNNLAAGTITSTSYIRAGSKNLTTGLGARIEISSSAIEDGTVDIAPGFYIYNSTGAAVLSAPLNGGLSIVGSGTFTGSLEIGSGNNIFKADGSTGIWLGNSTFGSANFRVSTSGILTALAGNIGGWIISPTQLTSNGSDYISLTPGTPRISIVKASAPNAGTITIDPIDGIKGTNFQLTPSGNLTATNAQFTGGKITVNAGASNIIQIGKDVNGTDVNGIYINTNNYWYGTGLFSVGNSQNNMVWNSTKLSVTGEINANSGKIGIGVNAWTYGELYYAGSDIYGISSAGNEVELVTAAGVPIINVGNYTISGLSGTGLFTISEFVGGSTYRDILTTNGVDSGDGGKIYLGDITAGGGRAVYVKKSAQIAGGTENANSGGLRNMFTATTTLYNTIGAGSIYSGAVNGDVLLVYNPG